MSEVRIDIDGSVGVITLDAPDRRNALTPRMATDLVELCDDLDRNPDVGAVVVRGEGGYFCAGAHRDVLAGASDPLADPAHTNLSLVYGAFVRVGNLEAPTIAAVRGGAVGAGLNLALATDLRVVADDAKLVSGFLKLGLHPGGGYFVLSSRIAGREVTAAMGLFGEVLDGRRAAQVGLAWQSLPDEDVDSRALELADTVAADPPLARRAARSFRQAVGPPAIPWPVALDAERSAQAWSLRRRQ